MGAGRNLISNIFTAADMDASLEPRQLIVEIAGNNRILVENYKRIVNYTPDNIRVNVHFGCIAITGKRLSISKMTEDQMFISGLIDSIQFFSSEILK